MYQLVKGRETIQAKRGEPKEAPEPEPVTKPIPAWVLPETSRRPWYERFGTGAACVALILLASWSAWRSLTAKSPEIMLVAPAASGDRDDSIALMDPQGQDPTVAARTDAVPVPGTDNAASEHGEIAAHTEAGGAGGPEAASSTTKSEETSTAKVAKVADSKTKEPATSHEVPAGAAGLADPADGILLRYNPDNRMWECLTGPTSLNRNDRLLCLAPCRAVISIGNLRLTMLGETAIRLLSQSADKIPAIELVQGRALLRQPPAGSLKVVFAERVATIELSPEDSLALARPDQWLDGRLASQAPPLEITCTQGDPKVTVDQKHESMSASSVVTVDTTGTMKRESLDSLPSWVTETEPSSAELQAQCSS